METAFNYKSALQMKISVKKNVFAIIMVLEQLGLDLEIKFRDLLFDILLAKENPTHQGTIRELLASEDESDKR